MKVRELIEMLSQLDQEKDIVIIGTYDRHTVDEIDLNNNTDEYEIRLG